MTGEKVTNTEAQPKNSPFPLEGEWSIRQCFLYNDEYKDCKSFKARFHQYFIHGESTDCTQWKVDYDNCRRFNDNNDLEAGKAVIDSETARRHARMRAHYANDTWKKRNAPPDDWNKPLPEWLAKKNENTYLEAKAKEMETGVCTELIEPKSLCTIM